MKKFLNTLAHYKNRIYLVLGLVAIFLSKSSIPYGVLACGVIGYCLFNQKKKVLFAIALIPLSVGALCEGFTFFDSGKRFEAYKVFMGFWNEAGRVWFGLGPGSFKAFGASIQIKSKFMYNESTGQLWRWPWMHSDWLEVGLFQLGIIGFILLVSIYLQTLYRLKKSNDKILFGLMCGFGSFAVFDYPKNYFPTAAVGMLFLVLSYRDKVNCPHDE